MTDAEFWDQAYLAILSNSGEGAYIGSSMMDYLDQIWMTGDGTVTDLADLALKERNDRHAKKDKEES